MTDASWKFFVLALQFIVGISTFWFVYMLTGSGVIALTGSVLAMAAHNVYWMWTVARD